MPNGYHPLNTNQGNGYPAYQEPWGIGPADEDDEQYHLVHRQWGGYGQPTAPRPYQRGEGAPTVPRGMGSRVAPAPRHYHYPYYGYGYTGYGQFGGGYGSETQHLAYETSGPYAGIAPSGYKKSDERIREEINDALTIDSWLNPINVHVAVAHGEVTLTGTIDSRFARRRAGDDAWAIPGVIHVHNDLKVAAQGQAEVPEQ